MYDGWVMTVVCPVISGYKAVNLVQHTHNVSKISVPCPKFKVSESDFKPYSKGKLSNMSTHEFEVTATNKSLIKSHTRVFLKWKTTTFCINVSPSEKSTVRVKQKI